VNIERKQEKKKDKAKSRNK